MAERRSIDDPAMPTGTDAPQTPHTTIIHETRSSNGLGIVMAVIVLVAVIGGIYLFSRTSAEATRDNAIAEAANDVGNAASQIGNAAEDAADSLNQ